MFKLLKLIQSVKKFVAIGVENFVSELEKSEVLCVFTPLSCYFLSQKEVASAFFLFAESGWGVVIDAEQLSVGASKY